jgi:hypothetical protein
LQFAIAKLTMGGMTPNDISTIEERLRVTLPNPYRQALLSGVAITGTDPAPYFQQSARELLITNLELRMVPRQDAFGGAPWPSRFVWIGADGCGNSYCIDADDPHCAVRFFDHETNSFETISGNLSGFFAHLADLFARVPRPVGHGDVPARAPSAQQSPHAVVARTDFWRESVLDPISTAEWAAFVDADSELQMRGYRVLVNPFTKAEVRVDSPGLAIMNDGGTMREFQHGFGRVSVRRPGAAALEKLKHAAAALNAKLIFGE